ncbi:RagB/SusD family nutrient uptake outer membrane protein [Epilithonimonas sp. JDS]|uniref:RagB/SusD family nutrient uptake outer membrane protein n=1 Tax=Epilithonimonas sp. JDS TaxID=2902797 RepID=UPI001E5D4C12|nr:RagB/SusD family nutrient uptake outer membrane protein [Epilithonimonas sp. JDS]MCD9854149.1 RagB/SusD family nutrient uptake outer membrane protein [Epilithonimonas sp. JDS]
MKKYILIASSLLCLAFTNSCSESDLELESQSLDNIEKPLTEEKIQMLLSGAYFNLSSTSAYGTEAMIAGDLLGDNLFVSTQNPSYLFTANKTYSATQGDIGFYGLMYNVIVACNTVINSTVASNANVDRIKAEAKIVRGFAYFTLVNYYSPSPASGVNQEYGVPIVLGNYDSLIQPARSTVAQVYEQIISDLTAGANGITATSTSKSILGKAGAELLLSRVYLTRRAPGDAALALQYTNDIINNATLYNLEPVAQADYFNYFASTNDALSEGQSETIWELDQNDNANIVTGIGSNVSLPGYYSRLDSRRCLLFTQNFYNTFTTGTGTTSTDVRRGATATGATSLLISTGAPATDTPKGFWTNKYPRLTSADAASNQQPYFRNIKVLRFAEAELNRIEALYHTGQQALALTELNSFATKRRGKLYSSTGAALLTDILTERAKEFYGEGQRFLDLKRYNLPIVKATNCVSNCNVPAGDKLFVLPVGQGSINANPNLKQYPGYN